MGKLRPENHTLFQLSKPWGYFPPKVDEAVGKYEAALMEVNSRLSDVIQENKMLKEKLKQANEELQKMQLEMSLIDLPDVEDVVESHVLDKFTRSTHGIEAQDDFGSDRIVDSTISDPNIKKEVEERQANQALSAKPSSPQLQEDSVLSGVSSSGIDTKENSNNESVFVIAE